MTNGIAILGLNGSGKSTLAHAVANEIRYYEMDVEDYYFPEQKYSRRMALDHLYGVECEHLGELPFSIPREKYEVEPQIWKDMKEHPKFILAGVTMNWSEEIIAQIDLAFLIETPVEERIQRINDREKARFGARVLEGGDMYEEHLYLCSRLAKRDDQIVKDSILKLKCPVIALDGMQTVSHNMQRIIQYINSSTTYMKGWDSIRK